MRRLIPILLTVMASTAMANDDYAACVADAASRPQETLALAEEWRALGGGAPAEHCAALALAASGQSDEAARRLEGIAWQLPDLAARADALSQAGDFWLQAGQTPAALAAFDSAVAAQHAIGPLAGRARARAAAADWAGAEADLSAALHLSPDDTTLLSLRAAARRHQGANAGAYVDADRAIALNPGDPLAWLERGSARAANGDLTGARGDWGQAVSIDPNGAAGSLARQKLEGP